MYRVYTTDCLGGIVGAKTRYFDLIHTKTNVDTRSGDEIALDVIKKAGLKFDFGGEK